MFLFPIQAAEVKVPHFELEVVYFDLVSAYMHFFALNYLGSVFDSIPF